MIKTAVIMAGGRGERMAPLTYHIPKPLVKVIGGKSLILHVMDELSRVGIENFYITYGWLGSKVLEELANDHRVKGFINTNGKSNAWWVTDSVLSNLNEDILICPADLKFSLNLEEFQSRKFGSGHWLLSTESDHLTGDIIESHEDVNDYGDSFVKCIFESNSPTPPMDVLERASGLQVTNPLWLCEVLKSNSYDNWYQIWSELIKIGEIYNCRGCIEEIASFDTLRDLQNYLDRNTVGK